MGFSPGGKCKVVVEAMPSLPSRYETALATGAARILVVRLGSLGDILHTLPAVAGLRRAFPAARIGWAVEERWSELLAARGYRQGPPSPQKPLVDDLHPVNTLAWRTAAFSDETWKEAREALRGLRAAGYEVAIDFQGAIKSALLAQLARAPRRIGVAQPWERPASLFYTHGVFTRRRHVVEQNLELARALAPQIQAVVRYDLPCDPEAERACQAELERRGLRDFAILNPGAGWGAKRWPAERYAQVARVLAEADIASLVNHGPGEESLAREVVESSAGTAQSLACSLGELIAFTRRARIFVGGDTGPMHLAAALRVPVVALFGPTDPARNGPYEPGNGAPSGRKRALVLRSPLSSTSHARHLRPDEGLLAISAAEVTSAARLLLQESDPRA